MNVDTLINSMAPTGWGISAAFNGGLAYYLRKSHPKWALFFAFNAATAAMWATRTTKR
jgi:hypothetical protein